MGKDVRIIAAGGYDTRGSDVAANISRDRRFVNYIRTVNPETGRIRYEKRPGFVSNGVLSAGDFGQHVIKNSRYGGYGYLWKGANAFTGSTAIEPMYGTTSLGTISTAFNMTRHWQSEAQLASGYYHLISASVGSLFGSPTGVGYYYNVTSSTATGALTQIIDADFPAGPIGPLTQKWGYTFVMDVSGNAQNSDLDSITAWTAGAYFPCNAIPDTGRGIWSNGADLLAAFCSTHIEILYNANVSVLSPVLRANGGVIEIGLAQSGAVTDTGLGLAFVGQRRGNTALGVYLLSGMQVTKLSTPVVDQYLQTVDALGGQIFMTCFPVCGDLVLTITTSADLGTTVKTICCRMSDKFWFEWYYSSTNPIWPTAAVGDADGGTIVLSGGNNSGKSYTLDIVTPAYTDDTQAYTGLMQVTGWDFGTDNTKSINSLTVIGDKAASTDSLAVLTSDDDGANWTSQGALDMSTENRRLTGLGPFRKFGVRLTHATAVASRIEAVDVNVSKWSS